MANFNTCWVIQALVISRLDYFNVVYVGLLLKNISEATTTAEWGSASSSWGLFGWEQLASKYQLQGISVGEGTVCHLLQLVISLLVIMKSKC